MTFAHDTNLVIQLREIARAILDETRPAYSLRAEILELKAVFEQAGGTTFAGAPEIAAGETITDSGVAISPTMAAMCLDDFARTVQFMRGLSEAIDDVRSKVTGRPVRILYAGCGPWATLATPLMSLHPAEDAVFTLLDIHDESVECAKRLIDALELSDHVGQFVVADAVNYKTTQPDIVVVEMLRAALADEPQVAVAANLFQQSPDAVMIPELVRIDVALVDRRKEFDDERDRIILGTALLLERGALETRSIEIPAYDSDVYTPMLLTTIRISGEHVLRDYDSGVTCPRVLKIDGLGRVEFHYEAGRSPRLSARKVAENLG